MRNQSIEPGASPGRTPAGVPIVIAGLAVNAIWTAVLLGLALKGLLWLWG